MVRWNLHSIFIALCERENHAGFIVEIRISLLHKNKPLFELFAYS
jgi:hypothetical protein